MRRGGGYLITILIVTFILMLIVRADYDSSDATSNSEWRGYGRITNNNRYYSGFVAPNISQIVSTNYTMPGNVQTGPVVANGYLYFVSGTGNKLFQMNYSNISQQIANFTTSGNANYAPALTNDYVYVTGGSVIHQVNASNVSQQIANFTAAATITNPLVVNESLYFIAGTRVHQLNSSNISQQITNYTSAQTLTDSASYGYGNIYVSDSSTSFIIRQLNASNISQQINTGSSGGRYITTTATIANGYAYICNTRYLQQVNATNVSKTIGGFYHNPDLSISCSSSTVANGYAYLASSNGNLYQANASNLSIGAIGSYNIGSLGYNNWITVTNTSVFVAQTSGNLYQLDATNISRLIGKFNLGTTPVGPTIVDGKILFSKQTNILYQLYLSTPSTTQNSPTNGYQINNSLNLTFSCTASYDVLANISLYITNNQNTSFSLNQTTDITGSTNTTIWNLGLAGGNYTWNCLTYGADGNYSWGNNRSITLDTIAPTINITSPTNNTNISNNQVGINYTANDTYLQSCWYSNDTWTYNYTLTCGINITVTWSEGQHNITVWANDSLGNTNKTVIRFFIDSIKPTINFTNPTDENNSIFDRNWTIINVTSTDTNLANITVYLFYSNGSIMNRTKTNTSPNYVNITRLLNGIYYFNATATDTTNNINYTETRIINISYNIDITAPNISIVTPTETNNTQKTARSILVNITANDINIFNITINLYNTTAKINTTNTTSSPLYINFTVNYDGIFYFNATATDSQNNKNYTETRQVIIDSTAPTISILSPTNSTYNNSTIIFNVTTNENATVWFTMNNGTTNTTMFANSTRTGFNYTQNSLNDTNYNFTVYANDSLGNTRTGSILFSVYTQDSDSDGILDTNDTLIGNESNINNNGLSNINITIGNQNTTGIFSDLREVLIRDGSTILINFSNNFSSTTLNLTKIFIQKTNEVLIINFSDQNHSKKTVYFDDNSFSGLCIKDDIVSSSSDISTACTGSNELNFVLCIGNSTGFTSGGITCVDEGNRFIITNLTHSGIRGITASSSSSESASSAASGSGGSCTNSWDCTSWSFCTENNTQTRTCQLRIPRGCLPAGNKPQESRTCPQALFDLLIEVKNTKKILSDYLSINVSLKEMNNKEKKDIKIEYLIIDKENKSYYNEEETRAVEESLSFIKEIKISKLKPEEYIILVRVRYGNNQAAEASKNFIKKKNTNYYYLIISAVIITLLFLIIRNNKMLIKFYKIKRGLIRTIKDTHKNKGLNKKIIKINSITEKQELKESSIKVEEKPKDNKFEVSTENKQTEEKIIPENEVDIYYERQIKDDKKEADNKTKNDQL